VSAVQPALLKGGWVEHALDGDTLDENEGLAVLGQ